MKAKTRHTDILFRIVFSLFILWGVAVYVHAQPAQPLESPSEGGGPVGGQEDPVPIGSGLVILLALGAGYGIVKLKQRKSPKE